MIIELKGGLEPQPNVDFCPDCKQEIKWEKHPAEFTFFGECGCPLEYSDDAAYGFWSMSFIGPVMVEKGITHF